METPEITKDQVIKRAARAIDELFLTVQKFPWRNKSAYSDWVAQTYFYVNHTTRHLALAAAVTPADDKYFQNQYLEHAREEKSHELLALNDLKYLGHSPTDFPERPSTAALYQTMYYMIKEVSPQSILGYALVLEGLTSQKLPAIYDIIAEHHGPKAGNFLRVHIQVDVDHREEGLKVLDHCSEDDFQAIIKSIGLCEGLYRELYDSIIRDQTLVKSYGVPVQKGLAPSLPL